MSTTQLTATLNNVCTCQYCPTCDVHFYGDYAECWDCGAATPHIDYCTSGCWDDGVETFVHLLTEWAEATGHTRWYVTGYNLGWRHLSGHSRNSTSDPKELLHTCGINGDYHLRYTYDEAAGTFTIVRTRHDEMGALLQVLPAPEEMA